MIRRTVIDLSLIVFTACQPSTGAQVDVKSSGQVDSEANASLAMSGEDKAALPGRSATDDDSNAEWTESIPPTEEAMLGARSSLRLNKARAVTCKCLSVAVGNPTDPTFSWEGPITRTNPVTQMVIGLSSEGLQCPQAATDSLGASYHGYEVVGTDVVVEVETGRLGRPIAQGAIIPKPPPGGHVVVRSVDRKSPYGQSPDGKSQNCTVWTAP